MNINNIFDYYENNKIYIIIILSIIFLYGMYPYILYIINPKINLEDMPFGKFFIDNFHGNNRFDLFIGIIYLLLNIILIYEIYKYNNFCKTTKIILITIIIYFYTLILYPLLALYNQYLALFYNNPPFIDNINNEYSDNLLLETNFDIYNNELHNYMNKYDNITCIHDSVPGFIIGKTDEKCWRVLHIKTIGKFKDDFKFICPELYKILDNKRVYNAFLSILDPYVNIPIHTGYCGMFLRYHIGIDIPEYENKKPFIVCGGQKYQWQNGKGVIFDDMYPHYVENPTPYKRIVLYIDLIRNDLIDNTFNDIILYIISSNYIINQYNNKQHQQKKII
jgi:aspartate beta-hydroxylase